MDKFDVMQRKNTKAPDYCTAASIYSSNLTTQGFYNCFGPFSSFYTHLFHVLPKITSFKAVYRAFGLQMRILVDFIFNVAAK